MDAPNIRNYILVNDFVERMDKHWTEELGNVSSPALKMTWQRMGLVFQVHITSDHDHPEFKARWNVMSPPTGAGKTEGAVIYCSMLADVGDFYHPGCLIVTRLIEDCNIITERINRFGSRPTAVAFHSESETKLQNLKDYPVVVITHSAYEQALDHLGSGGTIEGTWSFFHDWMTAGRRLVVVDECIDVVDHQELSEDNLNQTLGVLPRFVRERHPRELKAIRSMLSEMEKASARRQAGEAKETMLRAEALDESLAPDLTALIKSMDEVKFNRGVVGRRDTAEQNKLRGRVKKVLRALHCIYRAWVFCAQKGKDYTLNTARLLVPPGTKGAVVLDATAEVNAVYDVGDAMFNRVETPEGVRTYKNFTLHVSRGHRVS